MYINISIMGIYLSDIIYYLPRKIKCRMLKGQSIAKCRCFFRISQNAKKHVFGQPQIRIQ